MKKILCLLICLLMMLATRAFAETSEEVFQRMLKLDGTWEGKYQEQPIRLRYQKISDDAALLETLELPDGSSMNTVYHTYGDQLMATHYCKGKNQPRLVAPLPEAGSDRLAFRFVDGTNLGKSYVSEIELRFIDENTLEMTHSFKGSSTPLTSVLKRTK